MIKNLYLSFKTLSPSLRLALYAVAFLLVCCIIFLPLYLSKINELKSIQSEINEVENNLLEGKQLQARCELPTEDEKKVWSEIRYSLYGRIPPEKRLLKLVKDIAKVAYDCSIYDVSFSMPDSAEDYRRMNSVNDNISNPIIETAAASSAQGNMPDDIKLNRFSIKTSFHCRYQDLARFLKGINNLPRLIEVESLEIKRRLPLMEVEMAINAFYSKGREDA